MKLKLRISFAIVFLVVAPGAYSKAPENSRCVAELFREYISVKAELYNSIAKEMKNDHPEVYPVIKPCIDVFIADAELSLQTFEKLWANDKDIIFEHSKKLRRLGSHYDRDSILKNELEACEYKNPYPVKQRQEAWLLMRELATNKFSELSKRDRYLESLKWPNIGCK